MDDNISPFQISIDELVSRIEKWANILSGMVANADTKTLDLRWKLKRYYKFLPASCQNCTNILLKYLLLILEVKNARDGKSAFKNIFGTIKLRLQDPAHMNILLYLLLIGDSNVTIYLFTFILHIILKNYKQTKEYFD